MTDNSSQPTQAPAPAPTPPMTAVDLLKAARNKITRYSSWCQHSFAATANGHPVDYMDPTAERWCARGALYSVLTVTLDTSTSTERGQANVAFTNACLIRGSSPSTLNDSYPAPKAHAMILGAFDDAIEQLTRDNDNHA